MHRIHRHAAKQFFRVGFRERFLFRVQMRVLLSQLEDNDVHVVMREVDAETLHDVELI